VIYAVSTRPERTCVCGAVFSTSRRRDALYCTAACRVREWKRANRASRKPATAQLQP
jgi:hypothetical protein